jgi:hypothetical protein
MFKTILILISPASKRSLYKTKLQRHNTSDFNRINYLGRIVKGNTAGGAVFRGLFEQGLAEGLGELQVYFSCGGILNECTFTFKAMYSSIVNYIFNEIKKLLQNFAQSLKNVKINFFYNVSRSIAFREIYIS